MKSVYIHVKTFRFRYEIITVYSCTNLLLGPLLGNEASGIHFFIPPTLYNFETMQFVKKERAVLESVTFSSPSVFTLFFVKSNF